MKKITVLFFVGIISLFFPLNASAQTPGVTAPSNSVVGTNPQTLDMNTNPDVPQNLSTYTQSVFIEITSAASCLLAGVDPIRPDQPCLGFDPETKKLGYVENTGGALGMMGGLIGATFNIPASSGEYTHYLATHFGITQNVAAVEISPEFCAQNPDTCAQCGENGELCTPENDASSGLQLGTGYGFTGLTPLLGVWTAFRNIVYLLFVFIFVILGLGIMFRIQIDPRAVMSIQNQLPKIVIALILVTFSYAIAGFLVDMMYLSLFLIINIFQGQGLETSTSLATNPFNAAGGFGGVSGVAYDASKGIAGILTSLFDGTFGTFFKGAINVLFGFLGGGGIGGSLTVGGAAAGAAIGAFTGVGFGAVPGALIGGAIGSTAGGLLSTFGVGGGPEPFTVIVGSIAWLIIIIALLSALFRLWFSLLKTYIGILIKITFAPFWIAGGLLPGTSFTFGGWIRSLVADLAAFPIVLALFSLGRSLQNGFSKTPPNTGFVPPFIGDPGEMNIFGSLIGMGMILLLPEAVNIAKSALKSPENKLGSAIGRPLGTGQAVVGNVIGGAKNALWHTNPYSNQPSRFKAAAKSTAATAAGKTVGRLPGAQKVKSIWDKYLPSNEKREADAKTKSDAEKAAGSSPPPSGEESS